MKVSLITTVRDEAGSAAALIDAVHRQSRSPDEWIVVDGGSGDETAEIFAASPMCTLRVAPGGISHGRNLAISMARNPVIAVTDGGCLPDPEWLRRLVGPIEDDALRADVAVGATRADITSAFDAAQWIVLDQFVRPGSGRRQPAPSARSLAFRREVWQSLAFPEWLETGEDTWLLERWRRQGRSIAVVDDAVVTWNLRGSVAAVRRQHLGYMRGDGRALMHLWRHAARFSFYALLGAGMLAGPVSGMVGAAFWVAYLGATGVTRAPAVLAGRKAPFALASLLWLPVLLPVVDAAKMEGFLRGVGSRLASGRGGST